MVEFANEVMSRVFGLKRKEVTGENCIMRSHIFCALHQFCLRGQIVENMLVGIWWGIRNAQKSNLKL
jgi:hypothetical protein